MISDDQIKTWGALAAAATPGPWEPCGASDGRCVCGLVWANPHVPLQGDDLEPNPTADDAAFICAARTAVPALVSEVETLRDMLRVSEEQNEALGDANVLSVENDRLRAALREACDIADAALMPNDRVSREWYEQHAENRDSVRRVHELRGLFGDPTL